MSSFTSLILVLLILWILGFSVFHIAGALIHILIIIAAVMILVRIIQGKNPFK